MSGIVEATREKFLKKIKGRSMLAFARESGLSRTWLIAFRDNKIEDPGADRLEKLQKFMETI